MKKYLLLFSLFIISLSACKKGDIVSEQAAVDDAKIQAYIKANNINATKDPSGIYYQVLIPGTGPYPVVAPTASTVQIAYSGTFLNGQGFDSSANTTASLSGFTSGFQTGLQHINKGGRILLIIPSALAYGAAGSGTGVPPNAVLVFKVDLIGFY